MEWKCDPQLQFQNRNTKLTHVQGLDQELSSWVGDVDPSPPVEGVMADRLTVAQQSCPVEVDHDSSDEPTPEAAGDVYHQVPPLHAQWGANGAFL